MSDPYFGQIVQRATFQGPLAGINTRMVDGVILEIHHMEPFLTISSCGHVHGIRNFKKSGLFL
nr:predicted protein [Ipomoea batatas]